MRAHGRVILAVATAVAVLAGSTAPVHARVRPAVPSDFNGDGYADLAIGAPGDRVGTSGRGAGSVTVIYGSATGLRATGAQRWTQATRGVKGSPIGRNDTGTGWYDRFGTAVASGDFDGDGYADLAIGVPGDRLKGTARAVGAVNVLYGSSAGLTAAGDQLWTQAKLPGRAERYDEFGAALATGDANGDGFWDLVVGIPGDDVGQLGNEGSAQVIYGGRDGLASAGSRVFTREMAGAPDESIRFGTALAMGDLDGDQRDDLAVGAPLAGARVGDVSVFYASTGRLSAAGSQQWDQDSPGITDAAEPGDGFGTAVEIGDFDGDGFGDLAVGVPWKSVLPCGDEPICRNGAVTVIPGSAGGLSGDDGPLLHFGNPGLPGEVAPHGWTQDEGFGWALAAGDLDGDGLDDLAISVPWDTVGAQAAAGSVLTMSGSADGLTTVGASLWSEDNPLVPGTTGSYHLFGYAVAIGDFGRDPAADLAIGIPWEPVGVRRTGAIDVLYGTPDGIAAVGSRQWSMSSRRIPGVAKQQAGFGTALAP